MPWKDVETERAYWRRYRSTHREEIQARDKKYWPKRRKKEAVRKQAAYLANLDENRAKQRQSYTDHREERLAYAAKRRIQKRARTLIFLLLNLEAILTNIAAKKQDRIAYLKQYYIRNKKKKGQYLFHWRRQKPEFSQAANTRRRARKHNAPVNDFTPAQWREMQVAFNHCCAYCGKRAKGHLTQEHITPLSKGGPHTVANVVPACKSCNSRKHDGPPLSPVQPLLLTIAPSKKPQTG